jgi:hypothetical protein
MKIRKVEAVNKDDRKQLEQTAGNLSMTMTQAQLSRFGMGQLVAQRVLVQRPQWVCGNCQGYVKEIGACCLSCGAVLVGFK